MSTPWVDLRLVLPGLRGHRVHVMAAADEPRLRDTLGEGGFEIATVAGSAVTNESTLFDELARALSFPPAFGRNWDALTDALSALAGRRATRLALIWVDAHVTVSHDLQTVLSAALALEAAAADLATLDGEGPPRQLEVFLLGSGAGFPPA